MATRPAPNHEGWTLRKAPAAAAAGRRGAGAKATRPPKAVVPPEYLVAPGVRIEEVWLAPVQPSCDHDASNPQRDDRRDDRNEVHRGPHHLSFLQELEAHYDRSAHIPPWLRAEERCIRELGIQFVRQIVHSHDERGTVAPTVE